MTIEEELEPHLTALRQYARSMAGNRSMADDLVQEALRRYIAHRRNPVIENLRAYLFRILRNVWNDTLAQARKTAVSLTEIDPPLLTTEGDIMGRLALRDMCRAFAQLPDNQRETLALVALEGLSYAQAASALDVPIGTVMSRIHRARAALRRALEGELMPAAAK